MVGRLDHDRRFHPLFLRDLAATWAEHGKATMVHTAKANPEVYFATCARLIPRDVQLTIEQTMPRGLDADDLAILKAIKAAIPDANSRSPDEVMAFVAEAVRAHRRQNNRCRMTDRCDMLATRRLLPCKFSELSSEPRLGKPRFVARVSEFIRGQMT